MQQTTGMTDTRDSTERRCANCNSPQSTVYCGECGQHERGSRPLRMRDITANCAEALLEVDSPLPATLVGLIRNPGQLCLNYVSGQRKRYLNPFAFLLVAVTAQVILSAGLRWTGWVEPQPDESGAIPDDALNWVLFAIVVPLGFLWTKLFASSGRNFAENYVLGLYLLGLFAWFELMLLPLTFVAAPDSIQLVVYLIVWLTIATWAGAGFYSMPRCSVFWRMLASTSVTFLVFGGLLFAVLEAVAHFSPAEITK